jgi:hypothetical protein
MKWNRSHTETEKCITFRMGESDVHWCMVIENHHFCPHAHIFGSSYICRNPERRKFSLNKQSETFSFKNLHPKKVELITSFKKRTEDHNEAEINSFGG